MFNLKDKVVVVTGGAGRIGSAFIKAIVSQNGVGVIVEIDLIKAKQLKKDIKKEFPNAKIKIIKLDITSRQSVNKLIKKLDKKYGRIDALVNNAYPITKNFGKKFFDIDYNDFCDFISLHLGGYFNISQQFIKYFLKQKNGNIINISSIQGVIAPAFETYRKTNMHSPIEYTVAKTGLLGMTKYMAKMFKKKNIRVNAISPGGILDNQPKIFLKQYKKRCGTKGILNSEDLVGTLLYLLSDNSKHINGQNIVVDDGFTL